ncbi:helix-turn-helix transcriptional regulator [Streptomyces sp. S1D4-11]|nr:helix-turn-helix transcriptional regulator [Streptomyces sp. S1D4-11]QIY96647.1 helix-turn-helix domain-containing protein [Streptomyces sp. S1D4-11]
MVHIRALDPSASPLDYFGAELRRKREEAGLKQSELGACIFCTGSLVGQIETAKKVPTRDFSERVDAALGTGVLGNRTEEDLDAKLAARMERQRILEREHPPVTWVVLSEAVLHQEIGGANVMREQLAHLLTMRDRRWLDVQVLPFEAGQHPGLMGSFTTMRFDGDPDIVYTEDFMQGHMTANPEAVREGALRYDQLQAIALSVENSAALIARVMEERYGNEPGPDQRDVA